MNFYNEHLLFILKKIFTFWREKEIFLFLIKSGAPLRKTVLTLSWEVLKDAGTPKLVSSLAALQIRTGRGSERVSKHSKPKPNKNQRQLSFPHETTVGWCLNHKMRHSPGPQNAFLPPEPVVIPRTGRPWGWEGSSEWQLGEWQLEHRLDQGSCGVEEGLPVKSICWDS